MERGAAPSRPRSAPASGGEKTAPTKEPSYRASPRTVTPRAVDLKADFSQTGHGSWTRWNEPEGEAAEGELVDRRRHGRWTWTWPNGKAREERNYRKGTLHGMVRAWYADGELQVEEEYFEGKPHGRWRAWYGGGQLAWEENYNQGVKHGDVTWFHSNGTPSMKGRYESGRPVGEWVHSDARGQVVERRTFE